MKQLVKRIVQGRYNGLNGLDRQLEAYVDYDGGYFVEAMKWQSEDIRIARELYSFCGRRVRARNH